MPAFLAAVGNSRRLTLESVFLRGEYINTATTIPIIAPTVPTIELQIMNCSHCGWCLRNGV